VQCGLSCETRIIHAGAVYTKQEVCHAGNLVNRVLGMSVIHLFEELQFI